MLLLSNSPMHKKTHTYVCAQGTRKQRRAYSNTPTHAPSAHPQGCANARAHQEPAPAAITGQGFICKILLPEERARGTTTENVRASAGKANGKEGNVESDVQSSFLCHLDLGMGNAMLLLLRALTKPRIHQVVLPGAVGRAFLAGHTKVYGNRARKSPSRRPPPHGKVRGFHIKAARAPAPILITPLSPEGGGTTHPGCCPPPGSIAPPPPCRGSALGGAGRGPGDACTASAPARTGQHPALEAAPSQRMAKEEQPNVNRS